MSGENSTAQKVLDALVGTGILTIEQLANASESASAENVAVGPLLVERGLVSADDIASVLEEEMGVPRVDLSSYAPEDDALALVPAGIAREARMLPLFEIEGILTVGIGDPVDVFALDEVGASIGVELEPVLTDPADLLGTLAQYYGDVSAEQAVPDTQEPAVELEEEPQSAEESFAGEEEAEVADHGDEDSSIEVPAESDLLEDVPPPPPVADVDEPQLELGADDGVPEDFDEPSAEDMVPVAPAFEEDVQQQEDAVADQPPVEPSETIVAVAEAERAEGAAAIDLDVLAVADPNKVAVLVADILEAAVGAGASHIQVLPYKHDFFLVFRVKGRLEKIASAPLSLQSALVEGFKQFARLSGVPSTLPALGRVRARYGDRDLAVTVSAVPTVAGQRVVITLRSNDPVPRRLEDLGMTEAETRALHAMVERGRGMLLVCAPVAGGRSQTYYSLVSRAAEVGKTVYSVERSIGYELPAVAQVMVNPGSSVRPSAYLAAGLRQDTDVVAVDSVQSVEDVHLAVEAAGRGRLVIATFAAGDIMSGVRRILDLGVEPHSLAAALTVGVGQRLVRTNCPNCTEETRSELNKLIKGLPADAVTNRGTGCPNCRNTGFAGVTGIFEVLPFTEAVRAAVAGAASDDELHAAALGAGMRAMVRSGLAKIESGAVSVEEIVRVLRLDA